MRKKTQTKKVSNKSAKTIKSEFFVQGMHCAACQLLIEEDLKSVDGVKNIKAKLSDGKVYIDSSKPLDAAVLSKLVEKDGYHITEQKADLVKIDVQELFKAAIIASSIFTGFLLLEYLGIVNVLNTDNVNLPFVFLIGIVASVSTCMAVVGGLVISLSSTFAKNNGRISILSFHLSRLIGFFLLGGVIGLLGSAFVLTNTTSFILSLLLFLVMMVMGINLLEITSKANKFQIRMPKSIGSKILRLNRTNKLNKFNENSSSNEKTGKYTDIIISSLLGALTFFLPCGFTQSMQVYSLTKGNFIEGALVMFTFALGTLPVLGLISLGSIKISSNRNSKLFFKTAGFLVVLFALYNFIAAIKVTGLFVR